MIISRVGNKPFQSSNRSVPICFRTIGEINGLLFMGAESILLGRALVLDFSRMVPGGFPSASLLTEQRITVENRRKLTTIPKCVQCGYMDAGTHYLYQCSSFVRALH